MIQKLFLTSLMVVISGTAHAIVVDKFNCELQVIDSVTGNSARNSQNFYAARLPQASGLDGPSPVPPDDGNNPYPSPIPPTNPDPNVKITKANFKTSVSLATSEATLGANVDMVYQHATRPKLKTARQGICLNFTTDYCSKKGDTANCSASATMCAYVPDPFDPIYGWDSTPIIGGIPRFNDRILNPQSRGIYDMDGNQVGHATLRCQFEGTLN